MIKAKGSLNGKVIDKQNLKGKINRATQYIEVYPETQTKTITPTKQSQIVLPDENIYALSQVTVNPIPNNYIDPDGEYQVIDNGKYNIRDYNSVDVNVQKGIFPTGTINITENGITDVTNYVSANVNVPDNSPITQEDYNEANDDLDTILEGAVPANIYPPDWSEIGYSNTPQLLLNSFVYSKNIYDNWDTSITSGNDMFREDKNLRYFPNVSTSNITSMYRMFSFSNLEEIPLIDTSNVVNMREAFSYSNLQEIPLIDTSNVKDVRYMFAGCTILVTVPILNLSEATLLASMFTSCVLLSNESLNNIMKICINATAYTGTKTLKILGLTSEQATTCQTLSNYQDFLTAGWTTGY